MWWSQTLTNDIFFPSSFCLCFVHGVSPRLLIFLPILCCFTTLVRSILYYINHMKGYLEVMSCGKYQFHIFETFPPADFHLDSQGRRTGLNSGGALRRGGEFRGIWVHYEYHYVLQKSPGRAEKQGCSWPPRTP